MERFWSKVNIDGNKCWLWTGAVSREGYGKFWFEGSNMFAHRIMHELVLGPIPDGFHVDHLCNVPGCVNPEHLEAVTPGENQHRQIDRDGTHNNASKTCCGVCGGEFHMRKSGLRGCRRCARRHSATYRKTRV